MEHTENASKEQNDDHTTASASVESVTSNKPDSGKEVFPLSKADDQDYQISAQELVHDYDDEDTIAEEEAENDDDDEELDDLAREGEIPIEELLARYGNPRANVESIAPVEVEGTNESTVSSTGEGEMKEDFTDEEDELYVEEEEEDDEDSDGKEGDSGGYNPLRLSMMYDESADPDFDPSKVFPSWKKEPRVGTEHQAEVPSGLSPYGDAPAYENQDRLLWSPDAASNAGVLGEESEENALQDITCADCLNVRSYCAKIQEMRCVGDVGSREADARSKHAIPDDEQALYVLQQCGHNFEEALRRQRLTQISSPSISSALTLWSEEECGNFEKGISLFGKDFHVIQRHGVRTRSVAELVQFYYLWKKTERHDEWMRQSVRMGKDKDRHRGSPGPSLRLHPGYTEYMQGLAREQDLIGENYLLNDRMNTKPELPATTPTTSSEPAVSATVSAPPVVDAHHEAPVITTS